ncbi:MAG: SpoIVB peptidase [Lachnospiraceae bacterium]|nr:SpoIVB peptidase [Lachnospiraceae bacterium]
MEKRRTEKKTVRLIVLLLAVIGTLCAAASFPFFAENEEAAGRESARLLIPGGMAFGVRIETRGVIVVGITKTGRRSPAEEADIRVRDVIVAINGKEVNSADEVTDAVSNSGGAPLRFTVSRGGKTAVKILTPEKSAEGGYKAGIWIRDGTAGIGTVTFIDPSDGSFGGLGHGICDVDTGELVPLRTGTVTGVTIAGVKKGVKGIPGELKGYLTADEDGSLFSNTAVGVFGRLNEIPDAQPIEVADRNEVREGPAGILCTLDGSGIGSYDVTISSVDRSGSETKSFLITVTDSRLIGKTGGIVQGMSGSPVIQNGKLIGAVTHVLVSDPEKGYGIFIDRMLSET